MVLKPLEKRLKLACIEVTIMELKAVLPWWPNAKLLNDRGSSIAKWLANLLTDPAAPGLIPSIPEIF